MCLSTRIGESPRGASILFFFCVFIFVYVHLLTSYFIYLYIRQDIVVHCLRMNIFQHKYNFRNREYYIINETGNIKRSVNQVTP